VTVYSVATTMQRSPDQGQAMKEAEWEISSHGLKWVEHEDMPEEVERAAIAEAIRTHTEVTGERPLGWWHGPLFHEHNKTRDGGERISLFLRRICR
jgi:peptidoglycan/xylan/chitin deacetylase (PgdA/CDA1 family)